MIVLLVACVLTNKVYADSANTLAMAQKEASKIKTQLDEKEKSLKTQEEKIQQLEKENSELKE